MWNRDFAPEDADANSAMRDYVDARDRDRKEFEEVASEEMKAIKKCKWCENSRPWDLHKEVVHGVAIIRCIFCSGIAKDGDTINWSKEDE
jgi:hypothetical protein